MKSYSIKTQIGILAAAFCLLFSGCALEDEWYSETTPDTFFRNKGDVCIVGLLYRTICFRL